jgi:hypothetical protein
MDQSRPGEQLIRMWAETQQMLLRNWLDTLRGLGGAQHAVRSKTVETWQAAVQETLEAQTQWTREWTATLLTTENPEELRERAQQGQEVLQRWIEAQRQLWQGWFEMVKGIDRAMEPATGVLVGQNPVQIWYGTAQKMFEAQAAWIRQWTTGSAGAKNGS